MACVTEGPGAYQQNTFHLTLAYLQGVWKWHTKEGRSQSILGQPPGRGPAVAPTVGATTIKQISATVHRKDTDAQHVLFPCCVNLCG